MMLNAYFRLGLPTSASNREVIRAIRSKLRPETLRPHRYRAARHAIYRTTLDYHQRAEDLRATVMRGNLA